jgi:hypothetical protein
MEVNKIMRRKRFGDIISTCITPAAHEKLEKIADIKVMSLSELTRLYIEEGLARAGAEI